MEDHYGLFSGTQLARSREVLTKFKAPTYTSADRDLIVSPEEGMMIYQSTDDQFEVYENDTWTVISSAAAGAEANTASNTGSAGTGVFKQKTGVDLELYKLNSANSLLTIALDGTDKIDFTLNEGSLDHTGILNIGTNTHAQLDTHKTIAESHMSGGLDKHASTTSAELATVISDETGTGLVVFNDSPQLLQPDLRLETTGASTFTETGQIGWVAGPKYMTIGDGTTTRNFYDKTVYDAAYQATLAEGAFVDGDKTKLDGIEASADVTDTANVTSAGALMDSELTSIANVKALDQSVVSGATPTFTNTNFTEATDKNYVTDAEKTVIGNTSGTNTGDQTLPVKATGAELTTGTDDAKFATAKAIKDSLNVPSVAPGTDGNLMTSDGTNWVSEAAPVSVSVTTKGDLQGYDSAPARIPVGTNDQVLTADSTQALGVKWADAAAGDSASILIYDEEPTETPNGVITNFSTANTYVTGKIQVFKNGVAMTEGATEDFQEDGDVNGFTFNTAPATGDSIKCMYLRADTISIGNSGAIRGETPSGLINGSNTTYDTANTFIAGSIKVYLNGQRLTLTEDYTETDTNTIEMVTAPLTGDILRVDYDQFEPSAGNAANLNGRTSQFIQIQETQTGAYSTGTTLMNFDDTIPQNTEGDEYMTVSITPTSSSNKLIIESIMSVSNSATAHIIAALFQDSTANALAVAMEYKTTATAIANIKLRHIMTAGTTSATTFKIRIGGHTGTTYFNGNSVGRKFGGITFSSLTVTEIKE